MSGNEDEEEREPRGPGEAAPFDPDEEFPIDIAPEEEPDDEGEELPEELQPPEGLDEGVEIDPTGVPFALERFLTQHPSGELRVKVDVGGKQNTVKPRDVFPFEDQIIANLVEEKIDKFRRGANIPIKGPWIHGWLEENGEDYIASIFRNYQLFLKYVEGKTAQMNNKGTVERAPGTYDSMYTYLLILEKLDLVERFKREEIPEREFDHHVPDDFQDRTFLRVVTPLSEAPEQWRNPFKAQYPETFGDEEELPEEETEELPEEEEDDEDEQEEVDEEAQQETESEALEGDEVNTVDDLENPFALTGLITETFEETLQATLDDPPAPRASEGIEVDDFETGRIAIYGVWAQGNADPGDDEANILFEIKNKSAPRTPSFIPLGVARRTQMALNNDNPVPELFPSYDIEASFSNKFNDDIEQRVRNTQETEEYYDLTKEEFIDI